MIRRRTTEAGGGVLSFTFLDVLTCTMGSLVLLLVVLAQRSTNVTLEEALKNAHKPRAAAGDPVPTGPNTTEIAAVAADEPPATEAEHQLTPEELQKNLAELREQMPRLEKLRIEAAERARAEEARVSHLEDHERRLEHELAQLHVALARLEDTEKQQNVDQQTAERELERLRQLVDDTEDQIESMKKDSVGKKSYAIVPYKGTNGTFRRPIYIECTKDAVTIYPEGIKLTAADFDGPLRSGNPLAAALRAAREELNARAKAAGQTDLPDPYPLLIVRPDGAYAYGAATSAISSWDSDFGYEFVDADWKLEYPSYDPRLDQMMRHAVDQARQRQAMLAKAAPRRYGSRLALGVGEGGDGGGGDGSGSGGGAFEGVAHAGGSGDRIGDHSGENWMEASAGNGAGAASGGRYADNASDSATGEGSAIAGATGNFADQSVGGNAGTELSVGGQHSGSSGSPGQQSGGSKTAFVAGAERGASGGKTNDAPSGDAVAENDAATLGAPSAPSAAGQNAKPSAGAVAGGASAAGSPSNSNAAGAATSPGGGGAASGNGDLGGGVIQYPAGQTASAAQSRGANWANNAASRRASAITRPIRVIVRPSQIDVVPDADGGGVTPTAISFHQSTDKVLDQLAASVQAHIKDWGLAGNGMYWRPTLVLQVSPGAQQHAIRLNDLLRDSGVDVRFEEVASRTEQGGTSGPR